MEKEDALYKGTIISGETSVPSTKVLAKIYLKRKKNENKKNKRFIVMAENIMLAETEDCLNNLTLL